MASIPPMVVTLPAAGSGPSSRPRLAELIVEPLVDHAGLHANAVFVDPHMMRRRWAEKVDHQPRPQRFARHASCRRRGHGREADFRPHIRRQADTSAAAPRTNDPQRLDLIDAGVAGEQAEAKTSSHRTSPTITNPRRVVLDPCSRCWIE